jgi:hypothetical protein
MATHTDRPSRRDLRLPASSRAPTRQLAVAPPAPWVDQRPETAQLARLSSLSTASPQLGQLRAQQAQADARVPSLPLHQLAASFDPQAKDSQDRATESQSHGLGQHTVLPNQTGLPSQLKASVESLSGISLDTVKVHYNSSKPAQLNALAYTQGTDIHIGPGQEKHLPHEAWHVVQQAQHRVKPIESRFAINDDPGLEKEADAMGHRAVQLFGRSAVNDKVKPLSRVAHVSAPRQLFAPPPGAPPVAGQRNHTLVGGVPTESHVTTRHGAANDLVGTVPGVAILGWQHILTVGASGAWVRFHLVNEKIGGLGNQANLVPTSQATNHCAVWKSFETRIKALAQAQTGIHVTVDVTYPAQNHGIGLAAVSHYYPTNIAARVYYWNPHTGNYVLDANQPNFAPFPLLPPAVAGVTNLSVQSWLWVKNTLMAGQMTKSQAETFLDALQDGRADNYRQQSGEPTDEMRLLDALDNVADVECDAGVLPHSSREQVLNGAYQLP